MTYDLFEAIIGMQMMHNYFCIGGIDLPYGWIDKYLGLCDYFLPKVNEYVSGKFHINVIITRLVWPTNL